MPNILRGYFNKWIIWWFVVAGTLIVIENGVYYLNAHYWLPLKCKQRFACTRILLVADPQLIGYHNELLHFSTPFSIYDSDKYLARTYSQVFEFAKPDIVIFLGDLLDEGSTATATEFRMYVRRLLNIFQVGESSHNVRHIWIPGDNDIGGEGVDIVTSTKERRFQHAFSQPDIIPYKNITFYKINKMTQQIPKIDNREFYNTREIVVGISHIPLMFVPSSFTDKVLSALKPHVLLTAHEHKSMIISTDALLRQDRHITPVTPDNNAIFVYNLGVNNMYEILVPTCSYRMGTDKIGYGFAVIEKNELQYTVLWSPSRFPKLIFYAFVIVLNMFIMLVCICCRVRSKHVMYRKLRNVIT